MGFSKLNKRRDFGGIVAEKKQQYRQNRVVLIVLPGADASGYNHFTPVWVFRIR
ncbi:hypothetical protein [Cyclobacterium qasimii]|uniref:Uncharacterized protein n=1 Tax=Cyclobacterium qasimii M12-11B TaxID=641524 RepID=S7WP90_9BACT|nr:hypothetical protein [Cyclobacterium qasimii]EPR68544.1 hypothetical protein ADICYQ_2372 [Cyclobacterium qasimii M12-11B]